MEVIRLIRHFTFDQSNHWHLKICLILQFAAFSGSTLSGQQQIVLQSQTHIGVSSDIWGFVHPQNGIEYAFIRSGADSVLMFDVSNPLNPELTSAFHSPGFDMKTWDIYLYAVAGFASGNGSIIDLGDPQNPQSVGVFPNAHNIWIDEMGFLYAECNGLKIYDLNPDPTNPMLIFDDMTSQCHDAVVIGNRLYDFHGSDGTFIYSIENPAEPQLIGSIVDASIAYNHSGWATADSQYLYICDELAQHPSADISIWDISDLDNPARVGDITSSTATVHNFYIKNGLAYVSYYFDGIKVFDLSDPLNPYLIDQYDTSPQNEGEGFGGSFGIYPFLPSGNILVSDADNGLMIFRLEELATANSYPLKPNLELVVNYHSGEMIISCFIQSSVTIELVVWDVSGQIIHWEDLGMKQAGNLKERIIFNGHAPGIYFLSLYLDGYPYSRPFFILPE